MADAVVEGRVRDALDMIRRLQQDSEPPQLLLAMIVRQYRLVMLTRELLAQRARPTEMATRLGVANFVMQRLLRQAPLYSIDSLRRAYRLLHEADLSVKRGIHDDQTALELLVFQLAALTTNRDPAPGRARAAS
jgi:DNA polymerase-3 subunit delta